MSASIYWQPVSHGIHIDVAAPSNFIDRMTKVFGSYPWRFSFTDVSKLEVLAATNDDGAIKNPYEAIIEAINGATAIEVWPEY